MAALVSELVNGESRSHCRGVVWKANRSGRWQKRFCEIVGYELRYFDKQQGTLRGSIDLGEAAFALGSTVADSPYTHCFRIIHLDRTYNFCVPSSDETASWAAALKPLVQRPTKPTSGFTAFTSATNTDAAEKPRSSSVTGGLARRLSQRLVGIGKRRSSSGSEVPVVENASFSGELHLLQEDGEWVLESFMLTGNILQSRNPLMASSFVIGAGTRCVEVEAIEGGRHFNLVLPCADVVSLQALSSAQRTRWIRAIDEVARRTAASQLVSAASAEQRRKSTVASGTGSVGTMRRLSSKKSLTAEETVDYRAAMMKESPRNSHVANVTAPLTAPRPPPDPEAAPPAFLTRRPSTRQDDEYSIL